MRTNYNRFSFHDINKLGIFKGFGERKIHLNVRAKHAKNQYQELMEQRCQRTTSFQSLVSRARDIILPTMANTPTRESLQNVSKACAQDYAVLKTDFLTTINSFYKTESGTTYFTSADYLS